MYHKQLKTKDKKKIVLNAAREKQNVAHRGIRI
jgi:hypothetical protein